MRLDYRGTKRIHMVFPCGCAWEKKLSSYGATTVVDAYTFWTACDRHEHLEPRAWNGLRREDFEEFLAASGYTEADAKREEVKPMFELSSEMVREWPWGYEPRAGKKYFEESGVCKHCRTLEDRQNGCSKEDMARQLGVQNGKIIMSVHDGPGCRVLVEAKEEKR